ncbi:MAG: RNA polymerase sigma factor [Gemmatimonadetes bacterium]|nr:RNA polymerase sigma factor [Gemmatimonadota bacterium]
MSTPAGAPDPVSRELAQGTPPAGSDPAAEAALLARVLAGESRAYATLVDRYGRRLYWSCLRLLGDPDDAEDAVQEAFVRAYTGLSRYDPAQRFYTWLFAIARNLCLNRIRRRKLWGLLPLVSPATGAELPAREDTGARVETRELAAALSDCLAALPFDQRECFHLRHEEEFSYEEIASALSIPMGTVMSRLSRAREKMRACLAARGFGRA